MMKPLIKSKLMSLFKSPDYLLFDKAQRSRVIVLIVLFLAFVFLTFILHLSCRHFFQIPPTPVESVLIMIVSLFCSFWWLSKKLHLNLWKAIFCKMNVFQLKYEVFSLMIFFRYLFTLFISLILLNAFAYSLVYLFVK